MWGELLYEFYCTPDSLSDGYRKALGTPDKQFNASHREKTIDATWILPHLNYKTLRQQTPTVSPTGVLVA